MIGKQILRWLFANAILPIVVPALFLAIFAWIKDDSFPIIAISKQLIKEGFYVFSALTLVFSLYEEYDLLKKCVGPPMQTWLLIMAISTLFMFYLVRKTDDYMINHKLQFCVIWFMTAISALIVKFKILRIKQKNGI